MPSTKKRPEPRTSQLFGQARGPVLGEHDTWLEAEDFCYPRGGMKRRCLARVGSADGPFKLVWCGIPDTYFSIPVRGGGWVGSDDGTFIFHPKKA